MERRSIEGEPAGDVLVEVRDLRVHFAASGRRGTVHAVDGVDLDIRRGEVLSLVGESGCGKSTTGRAILQLYRPTSGSVTFDGVDLTRLDGARLRRMRRRMQMIFQDPHASLDPRMTVEAIVSEPLEVHGIGGRRERRDRVRELLRTVGLDPSVARRYPHEFSGGQRQRIGIARALAIGPDFIVADEPVSALDVSIQAQLLNLLQDLREQFNLTFLFVSHDLAVVEHISDRVAVMYLGVVVEIASARRLLSHPTHPYTIALLSAVPSPDPEVEQHRRRIILVGDVPSPIDPPSGCRFRTRCWLRERLGHPENCEREVPPLRHVGEGQYVACHWTEQTEAHASGAIGLG